MDSIIIEKMETCSLVKQDSDAALGECEVYNYNYVIVNGCQEKVYKGMYIIHDGNNVYDTGYVSHMKDNLRRLLDEEYEEKLKEERRKTYLKLKKEFEHEK
jgi:DNA primase large subunit